MSVLYSQVVRNNYDPVFGSVNSSTITANTIVTSTINAQVGNVSSIYANYAQINSGFISSISTTSITLDGNTIDTAGSGFGSVLLLNGVPIATTSNLSSIADWAYSPAVSTVQMAGQNLSNANVIQGNSLSLVVSATVPLLNSGSIVNSNAMTTNTLLTTGLQTALGGISTTTFLKANQGLFSSINSSTATIPSLNATVATISSLSGNNFTASTGTFSSITGSFAPILNYSTLFVSTLSSVNIVGVTGAITNLSTGALSTTTLYAAGGTFANGPTFAGSRPTFTTGLNTIGADLGAADLNSVGDINGSVINMTASTTMKLQANLNTNIINDRGIDAGDHSVINIDAKYGSGGIVNITGNAATVLAPVVASQVNVTAAGNTAYLANSPVGGKVSISGNAGGASIAFPVGSILAGGGEVDITAYSYIGGTGITPGLVKISGGSCSMYSGPISPITGVYGYNYMYATLGNYIAAGSPPGGIPAFAGTNYMYGTNGTSINNGLFTDELRNYGSSNLNISAKSGNWVNISSCQAIYMGNNPIIDGGGGSNSRINNFAFVGATKGSISQVYGVSTIDNTFVGGAGGLYDLNILTYTGAGSFYNMNLTSSSNINLTPQSAGKVNINGALVGTSTIQAPVVSTLNVNISSINGAAYTPGGGGGGFVSTATSALNMGIYPIAVSSLTGVSSINGAAYPPASAGSWISTATTQLNMNANQITDLTGTLVLSTNNIAAYAASFMNIGVGTSPTYTTQSFTSTNIDLYQVGGAGAITTHVAGNLVDIVAGNIQTQATSTINTVPATNFTGDIAANTIKCISTFSRNLVSATIAQPVLQYGFASSTGASGTVTVTIPNRYTSQTSYIPFANMIDSPAAQLFVSSITRGSFIIGWTSAGVGNQTFGWQTMGL